MAGTVVIRIGSAAQARDELRRTLSRLEAGERLRPTPAEIWFTSLAQLAAVLAPRRLTLLKILSQGAPRSAAQLARTVKRSARSVEADLKALQRVKLVQLQLLNGTPRAIAVFDRISLTANIPIAQVAA